MENAKQVIQEVKDNCNQKSASRKDEITVMKAIMNDPSYAVDIYDKTGKIGETHPGADIRKVVTNAVSSITKIPTKEAAELVSQYEFSKADASAMVNFSKEFVHSYLQTGRKLPIGGRINSNIELMWKEVAERKAEVPVRDGNGKRSTTIIPTHGGIKASNPCPSWILEEKK